MADAHSEFGIATERERKHWQKQLPCI